MRTGSRDIWLAIITITIIFWRCCCCHYCLSIWFVFHRCFYDEIKMYKDTTLQRLFIYGLTSRTPPVFSLKHFRFNFDTRDLRIVFCVRIEFRIESAIRFDFESNFRIESAVYTTQAVTPSNELQGAPCRRTVYLSRTRVMHAIEYLLFISIQS